MGADPSHSCRCPLRPPPFSGAGKVKLRTGVLLDEDAWHKRLHSLGPDGRAALLAVCEEKIGSGTLAVGVIGSFTYDNLGWDDVDLVAVTWGIGNIDVRNFPLYVGGKNTSVDLISIPFEILADPSRAPDTDFPLFQDSRGEDYSDLCMRRRCMVTALRCSLNFAHWLTEDDQLTQSVLVAGEADLAFVISRLVAEARSYLADPEDRVKALRRLEMARLVARQWQPFDADEELLLERLRRDPFGAHWVRGLELCERAQARIVNGMDRKEG
ncbi:hypothetical protein ROS9278_00141 [Roseomonas sp. CECT 9278]|nr:hypothetical protein ROS9278_00141 [Roseomonas sp. CECT 9278]